MPIQLQQDDIAGAVVVVVKDGQVLFAKGYGFADVKARKLAAGYFFIGDEAFFRKRCREAILQHLVPADVRELSLFDLDLADVELRQVLDQARTPSLMAPFQVFFIR